MRPSIYPYSCLKMEPVSNIEQLTANLKGLELYLHSGSLEEQQEARALIGRGTCFLAYNNGAVKRFAPSRFIGYADNSFDKHSNNGGKNGGVTNPAISKLLKVKKPSSNSKLEEQYQQYCHSLGIKPRPKGAFGVERTY